jgi:hypothetical protein
MSRGTIPSVSEKDLKIRETLLTKGHLEHKFAVRLQTVVNPERRSGTHDVALILGINRNTVSYHVNRYL